MALLKITHKYEIKSDSKARYITYKQYTYPKSETQHVVRFFGDASNAQAFYVMLDDLCLRHIKSDVYEGEVAFLPRADNIADILSPMFAYVDGEYDQNSIPTESSDPR